VERVVTFTISMIPYHATRIIIVESGNSAGSLEKGFHINFQGESA
jgi:hypothetical protein